MGVIKRQICEFIPAVKLMSILIDYGYKCAHLKSGETLPFDKPFEEIQELHLCYGEIKKE